MPSKNINISNEIMPLKKQDRARDNHKNDNSTKRNHMASHLR